jgi:hypothetical protein
MLYNFVPPEPTMEMGPIESTGLREMFCPGGTAPMANDINIEFYTK